MPARPRFGDEAPSAVDDRQLEPKSAQDVNDFVEGSGRLSMLELVHEAPGDASEFSQRPLREPQRLAPAANGCRELAYPCTVVHIRRSHSREYSRSRQFAPDHAQIWYLPRA